MRDYSICYKCKLSEPLIKMSLTNGKPRGLCNDCRNLIERDSRNRQGIAKGFYNARSSLTLYNGRALGSLKAPEAYPLTYLNSGKQIGYIVFKYDSYLVNIWHSQGRYRIDTASMALWLSNQGLAIGSAPIALESPQGARVDLETIGDELTPENVADKLVVLDLKLQDYAVNKVRAELKALQDARRSINPPQKPKRKRAKRQASQGAS